MKIGIVTQSLLGNYGGILQNFALQQVLKKLGHEPMTIDYVLSNSAWRYFRHSTKFHIRRLLGKSKPGETAPARLRTRKPDIDAFVKKHIVTTQMVERYERNVVEQHGMGALVVGSDQVWRPKYNRFLEDMYLQFASGCDLKRVAYAASFGVDRWEYSSAQTRACSGLAKRFDAVSVREDSGVALCADHLGVKARKVLDPTLLLTADDYGRVCADVPVENEPFVAAYFLRGHGKKSIEANRVFAENLAAKLGYKLKYFVVDSHNSPTVEQWLAAFRDAAFVITESFHGTVFSILNHRQFLTIGNAGRGLARVSSLLNELGISDRMISVENYDLSGEIKEIDYREVEQRLDNLRCDSISFLENNLNG